LLTSYLVVTNLTCQNYGPLLSISIIIIMLF